MKRHSWCWIAVVCWAIPTMVVAANELPWEKKLPFASATIHYTIKGMEEGSETLYIRDNGRERATYRKTVANVMGMSMNHSTITFKTGDFIHSFDLLKREGFKSINPQKIMIEEYNKLSIADREMVQANAKKMGAAYAEGMGGNMQQNAVEILGFMCDKVEISGGSASYLIHDTDIVLKTDMIMMGMKVTMVADSIEKDKADGRFFKHPEGITAEVNSQSDEMAQSMAKQAILMLKDPENVPQNKATPLKKSATGKPQMSEEDQEIMKQMEQMMKGLKEKRPTQ